MHERFDVEAAVIPQSAVVPWGTGVAEAHGFVPLGTGDGGNISVALDESGVATAFRFQLDNKHRGLKQRAELQTCFVTNRSLRESGIDPSGLQARQLKALRLIYADCPGSASHAQSNESAWSAAVQTHIAYDLYIPRGGVSTHSEVIIGQFHGREDPRVFQAPNGTVLEYSTSEAARLCANASRRYGNCVQGQLIGTDGEATGWRYQSGGFPPLYFGYDPGTEWF